MKLLVVSHSYMEAVPRQKWFVLREAAPEIELLIITPQRWREHDWWPLESERHCEKQLVVVPLRVALQGWVSRHAYISPALPGVVRRFRPDAIQVEAEPWSAVYAQMVLLRRLVAPAAKMLFFTWWNTPRKIPMPFCFSHRLCLEATDLVLAGNHGALEVLKSHGYRGPVEVVPQLGVGAELFRPSAPDSALRAEHSLAGSFVIGYVGRLTGPKGVDPLLDTAARLPARGGHLPILGQGEEWSEDIWQVVLCSRFRPSYAQRLTTVRYASATAAPCASQVNFCAASLPRCTSSSRKSWDSIICRIRLAIPSTSSGSKREGECCTTSGIAPRLEATTGVPEAIASDTGRQNPSWKEG